MLGTESCLAKCTGVIHVGANYGQERDLYARNNLSTVWFEANPEVYNQLQQNILNYPKQQCHCYAVTDQDRATYPFYVTNNEGQSSSIFELAKHKVLWPSVHVSRVTEVQSITLDTFMKEHQIDLQNYQFLHIDVQGADLLVLRGAEETS